MARRLGSGLPGGVESLGFTAQRSGDAISIPTEGTMASILYDGEFLAEITYSARRSGWVYREGGYIVAVRPTLIDMVTRFEMAVQAAENINDGCRCADTLGLR
jgi:hypothetical protein